MLQITFSKFISVSTMTLFIEENLTLRNLGDNVVIKSKSAKNPFKIISIFNYLVAFAFLH